MYTPDLLIASKWRLIKAEKDTIEHKALLEIKTPTSSDRKHAESEIKEYLEKVTFVILTDCVTWEFYMKEEDTIFSAFYSLEEKHKLIHLSRNRRFRKKFRLRSSEYEFPARVCERYQTAIVWNDAEWKVVKQTIKDFRIKKENRVSF